MLSDTLTQRNILEGEIENLKEVVSPTVSGKAIIQT